MDFQFELLIVAIMNLLRGGVNYSHFFAGVYDISLSANMTMGEKNTLLCKELKRLYSE